MPELPEVEILVRHLRPLLKGRTIRNVEVFRPRSVRPDRPAQFETNLNGAKITDVQRRAKFLVFDYRKPGRKTVRRFFGHLGMSGRMYLQNNSDALPKHVAVCFDLASSRFVFEDTRYFGRMTLDLSFIGGLGPEPLDDEFTVDYLKGKLIRSSRPIKSLLMEQSIVAGLGNIYASEALFEAGISPLRKANKLTHKKIRQLHSAIRKVLDEAIQLGSTISLNWNGGDKTDGLFYFGSNANDSNVVIERFRVYGCEGEPCHVCGKPIRRIVQSGRSTFFCPKCQYP